MNQQSNGNGHYKTLPQDILFPPTDIARLGIANLEYRRNNQEAAVPLGLDSIDKDFLPLIAGELMSIIARPGNGKTSFMIRWARHRSDWLMSKNMKNRAVIYVTAEQTIEELYAFGVAAETQIGISQMARGHLNNEDWRKIERASMSQAARPLWLIGPSKANRKKRPKITASAIVDSIFYLEESTGIKPDIVFIDYLQLIKPEGNYESKVVSLGNIQEALKDGAMHTDCPWVVGVQAKRDVDMQSLPVPGMDSGQWTSTTEQYSDKIFSLVRPSKYKGQGETFGSQTVQGHSQMLVSMLKQKLGIDNKAYWVHFDMAYNRLNELEMRYAV